MIIRHKKKENKVLFGDLEVGDTFRVSDIIYMKANEAQAWCIKANKIFAAFLDKDDLVIPVDVVIEVTDSEPDSY